MLRSPRPSRRTAAVAAAFTLSAGLAGCTAPDPQREMEFLEPAAYWVADAPAGGKNILIPEVRFRLRNKGTAVQDLVQVNITFTREGDEVMWGSVWRRVTPPGRALAPGDSILVVMRSDGRYTSELAPDEILRSAFFRNVSARIFVRVGSSGWSLMSEMPVERRLESGPEGGPDRGDG